MDTGIGKDGYSVIGQGRIDEILSNNSDERRKVFEEATGIVKYRERKKEALKNIENTENNLVRVTDILNEIEGNVGTLKEQSEKAIEYLELKDEKKKIDLRLFRETIRVIDTKLNKAKEELLEIEKEIDFNKENAFKINQKIGFLNEEIKKIEEDTESSYNNISQIIEDINSDEKSLEIMKEKIKNLVSEISRLDIELQENEIKIKLKIEDKNKKNDRKNMSKNDSLVFKKELEEKENLLKVKKNELGENEENISKIKEEIEQKKDQIYDLENEIHKKNIDIDSIKNKKKLILLEKSDVISSLDKKRQEISEEKNKFKNENSELINQIDKLEESKEKSDLEIKSILELKQEYQNINNKLMIKKNELKLLENLEKEKNGFSHAIKTIYKEISNSTIIGKKTLGVLADIVSVEKKYTSAIQTALGQAMQNIVVEKEEDANDIIEFLKSSKNGRATFLPLTRFGIRNEEMIQNKDKYEKLNEQQVKNANIKYAKAIDVVNTDKKYEGIMKFLLANTYIVDNMNEAIMLSKKVKNIKILTLDGDVLNSSGSITGGYQNKSNNLIGRKNQIEDIKNEIITLEKEYENKKEEYLRKEGKISEINEKLRTIEKELSEQKITLAIKENKIKNEEEKVEIYETRLENIKNEMINFDSDLEKLKEDIINLNISKDKILEELEENKNNINELMNTVEDSGRSKEIEELTEDIINLKISISSFEENEKAIQEIIDIIEEEINSLSKQNILKKEEIEKNKKGIEQFEAEINEINQRLTEKKEENEKVKEFQNEIKLKREEINKREEEIVKEKEIYSNREKELFPEKIKKEQELYKFELNKENLISNIWDEYELTLNNIVIDENDDYYESKNLNIKDFDNRIIGFEMTRASKILQDINSRLKKIGEVNISAIDEYNIVKERYEFLSTQKSDLDKTKSSLQKVIKDISATMEEQFLSRLELINNEFKTSFTELFGGGRAKIELEDKENPLTSGIEIRVEPPGKKLQNLSLLSGGERAFTAIAILFAILKINPSPFSVLDEIEAALDDANVQRYANYLKKYSEDTQFIIITHRKGTMESAKTLYGVTMEENGVSKLVSLDLSKVKKD